MECSVYTKGRRDPMRFASPTTAERYRQVICAAGRFAWIEYTRSRPRSPTL